MGMRKTLLSFLLVLTVGWLAYLLSREPEPPGRENLIAVSTSDIKIETVLETSSAEDAELYIRNRFGVSVQVPEVTGAEITGVGLLDVGGNVEVPTIVWNDPSGDVRRIFVFTYSLLDDWARNVFLERTVRFELEQSDQYVVTSTETSREVVLWRSGDDIFLAVAENGASPLISRLPHKSD
jgi:hypothetical protein